MRSGKRNFVSAQIALPAARCGSVFVETMESRTLLSGYALLATAPGARSEDLPQIDLSGAFAGGASSAMAGKKYNETISVVNRGSAPVSGMLPIVVDASSDGTLASGTALTTIDKNINIKAGKTAKITLSLKAPAEASRFYLVIQLDPQSTLGDNLASNTFSRASTVTVKTPPFKRGSIVGQNGWVKSDSGETSASTAAVSTSVKSPVPGNKQTIVISRAAGEDIGVAPPVVITSATPFTVTVQVQVNYKTSANGPFFGLNLFGNNGAVNIAAFGVNSANGDVVDFANGPGAFLLSDGTSGAPAPLVAGTWNTFKIVADFTGGSGGPVTLSYLLNNTLVDTDSISAGTFFSFSYAYLFGESAFGATVGAPDAAGTAAFDNYSLTTTAASTLPARGLAFP